MPLSGRLAHPRPRAVSLFIVDDRITALRWLRRIRIIMPYTNGAQCSCACKQFGEQLTG